ncbi:MAG: AAA family ATPase [Candidatus Obscuribacterales bacterium]|nr:AAA family ATPase [Candidatus Obscuribacterales bacterium]
MTQTLHEYFGFSKTPFGKDLSRQQLFMYPQVREMEEVLRLTLSDHSMSLGASRAGCGKTTVTRAFLEDLPMSQYKVIYLGQDRRGNSLLARLAEELGLAPEETRSYRSLHLSKAIERHISVSGKELVFVVDEAHLLDRSTLEDLRLLSNSGMDRRSMVSIILLGQIWLRDRLKYREYEALNQRLRLRYSLEGLSEAEAGQYIEHHLKLVGCSKDLFASEAVKQIFIASGGIPRPINNLCVASLLKAMLTKKKTVDGSLVKRVAREQAMT